MRNNETVNIVRTKYVSLFKSCLRCKTCLPLEGFAKNCRKKDGREIYCRACVAVASAAHFQKNRPRRQAQVADWAKANPGKMAAYCKAWRVKNPEAQAQSERLWYERNREAALAKDREQRQGRLAAAQAKDRERYWANRDAKLAKTKAWREANPARVAALAATRRAAKKQRTPPWLTPADWENIVSVYERCKALTEATGTIHHVDHEVPLRGRRVSGLHVAWNLRCVPARVNLSKSNRFEV